MIARYHPVALVAAPSNAAAVYHRRTFPSVVGIDRRPTMHPVAADLRATVSSWRARLRPGRFPSGVAAAVPSGGVFSLRPSAARDSGSYLGLLCALLLLTISSASADITGTVTLTGQPQSKDETFVAPVAGCGDSGIRHTENWKVGTKGELADVVVWIVDPKFLMTDAAKNLPAPEIEVKQMGCRYVPHVIAVQAGVPFKIINTDPTLHNIRAKVSDGPGKPPGEDVFNFGQPRQGQADDKQFDDPGLYTLQCDVHPWMQCWVMALKTRNFAVTDEDGKFKIWQDANAVLQDGDYKIDAWHPRFAQTLEQTIHVKNGTGTVNFQFDGAKSF